MINYDLIVSLIGDEKGAKTRLTTYVYGESGNKGFEKCFKNVNPRFDTCEKICDFFHISMDDLRMDRKPYPTNITHGIAGSVGNNNHISNITISSEAERENAYLRKELVTLHSLLDAKDETIATLKSLIEELKSAKDESISLYERHQSPDQ